MELIRWLVCISSTYGVNNHDFGIRLNRGHTRLSVQSEISPLCIFALAVAVQCGLRYAARLAGSVNINCAHSPRRSRCRCTSSSTAAYNRSTQSWLSRINIEPNRTQIEVAQVIATASAGSMPLCICLYSVHNIVST